MRSTRRSSRRSNRKRSTRRQKGGETLTTGTLPQQSLNSVYRIRRNKINNELRQLRNLKIVEQEHTT